jgi:putative tryptophan/tyrosine transport system substrate-binding protein
MRRIGPAIALALALVSHAGAQTPPRTARIGYLTAVANAPRDDAFRDELAKLGWAEGRNLTIERRDAEGRFERLPALADDLVRAQVDAIVSVVTDATAAAKNATRTIPIVMVGVGDPVGAGFVPNLARPGGNLTGVSGAAVEVVAKQIEYLRDIKPTMRRLVALGNPANQRFYQQQLTEAKAAAAKLRLELTVVEAMPAAGLDAAFARVAAARGDALLILADPVLAENAARIARFAIGQRMPTASTFPSWSRDGILLTYGPNFEELHRRAAVYVDRILKGAKPGDLAVERPTRFELVLNLSTARALGIALPATLVARADERIP